MQRYRKLVVLLSGSPADATAIKYTSRVIDLAESHRALVVCETKVQGQPTEVDPDAMQSLLRDSIETNKEVEIEFRKSDGHALTDVLRAARDEESDLVITGQRLPSNALRSTFAARVARKAPCTTFIVPSQPYTHLNRLLVPVDFSDHSGMALQTAIDVARSTQSATRRNEVLAMTTYTVSYGYHKTGKTFSQAAEELAKNTREKFDRFLTRFDTSDIPFDSFLMCTESVPNAIQDVATSRKMDMIVLGSRGLTASAAAVIGSTTEDVIGCSALPILIVKKKGETIGLLNALLSQVTN